jgi:hypothetical protein
VGDWIALAFQILAGLAGVVLVMFGAMLRRLFFRQDQLFTKLEEINRDKANRDSTDKRFDEALKRFDAHMAEDRETHKESREMSKELGHKLDQTNSLLATTNANLANLAGRFEERARNGHTP